MLPNIFGIKLGIFVLVSLISAVQGFVPFSKVTLIHNGNSEVKSIRSLFSASKIDEIVLNQRNVPFCQQLAQLNLKTPQFLVLVADNVLEPCSPPSDTLTVAQILFHGAESLVSFKDKKRTFSTGKIRVKNQVAVEIFKGMIFDVLEDDFLSKLDLETYKSLAGSRFWKWLQIPTWLAIVLGAVGFYYAENALSNLEVKKVSSATELFLIRTDKKYRDKPRLPQSRNKTVPITPDDFRRWMRLITEVIVDYSDHPDVYDVTPNVKPGFLIQKMPGTAPENPGTIEGVIRDVYELILPGSTHWQHPRMHAYYAAGASYPDIIGEILASGFGSVNFSWDSGPSMTELEIVMVNWAGKAFGLPESFLYQTDGDVTRSKGGGAIQSGASDAIFIALLAARFRAISESVSPKHAEKTEAECEALKNLVAYSSYEAHSSIEKAAKIALVKLRSIKPKGEHLSLKGSQLETEITKDLERGLKPFFVHVTLGTTATCAFDDLKEITLVAKKYNLWVHVDAAYAGSAFVCPEFRYLMDGIEDADSININLHKMFMLTTPSSILWTKNQEYVIKAMTVNPTYLKQHDGAMDFRHWSVLLSRRSNCFKIWCLMKLYGIRAMQDYVRRIVRCGTRMRNYIQSDPRLELVGKQVLGLTAFKIAHPDPAVSSIRTRELIEYMNRTHKIALTHAKPGGIDVIRVSMNFPRMNDEEVDRSWHVLTSLIDEYFTCSEAPKTFRTQLEDPGIAASPAPSTSRTQLRSHASSTSFNVSLSAEDVNNNKRLSIL